MCAKDKTKTQNKEQLEHISQRQFMGAKLGNRGEGSGYNINSFEMKCYRRMLRNSWRDKITKLKEI